mmetsp:Transcript_19886/g.41526  ORF Transcript_19886/g.41526 Transcript_19886/m.41526 type:complete len:224 (-) Transcript_19886:548-1219(-)
MTSSPSSRRRTRMRLLSLMSQPFSTACTPVFPLRSSGTGWPSLPSSCSPSLTPFSSKGTSSSSLPASARPRMSMEAFNMEHASPLPLATEESGGQESTARRSWLESELRKRLKGSRLRQLTPSILSQRRSLVATCPTSTVLTRTTPTQGPVTPPHSVTAPPTAPSISPLSPSLFTRTAARSTSGALTFQSHGLTPVTFLSQPTSSRRRLSPGRPSGRQLASRM